MTAPVKQIIVVRADLGMSRGKMAAQACHAAIGALSDAVNDFTHEARLAASAEWYKTSQTTVTLRVESEDELRLVYQAALAAKLPAYLVIDEGRTEFGGTPTATCIGIGPDLSDAIDVVTAHLKVFR